MNCRICNTKAEVYKKVKKGASNVSVLFDSPTKIRGVDFDVYRCRTCNHYQIIDIAQDDSMFNFLTGGQN
jgi:hypothetical protein